MLFNKVLSDLEKNKQIRESGEVVAIPWDLPRLNNVLPGIVQGRINMVTASSKVGKTQLGDFLYVYQPIEWLIKNYDKTNIKLKILYFSLEMSKDSKIRAAMSYKLFKDYGKIVSPENLQSLFKGYILDEEVLQIIKSEEFTNWFKVFEKTVEFHDEVRHNYGIYNTIKAYAENNGSYTYKEIDWYDDKTGKTTKRTVKDRYIPNNPDEYVIIVTDHISLLQPSKDEGTLHKAMSEFSSNYMLHARDKWNYIPVIIQQQAAASEAQQFTNTGQSIIDKLKPSADMLGDNKLCSRDVDLMLGLFWPHRYNFSEYNGWNLNKIGNNHRELLILMNRHGISKASIDLYFDGSCNYFRELPQTPKESVYNYVEEMNKIRI